MTETVASGVVPRQGVPQPAAAMSARLRQWLPAFAQSTSGAFYAWIDATTGAPAFEYPEITGYALTHLAAQSDPSEAEVHVGQRAGEWLAELWRTGRLAAREGWDGQAVYNFDLGMITNGLIAFGTRFGAPELVATGGAIGTLLTEQVRRDGHLESIDLSISPPSSRSAWSTEGYVHLVKVAQSLLTAGSAGVAGAMQAAEAVIAKGAQWQKEDGRFVTHPSCYAETMLHPHLYAVEGLWAHAEATGSAESRQRARSATEWAWQQQLPSGGLPRYVVTATGAAGPEQFDVTSQAVRAAVLLNVRPAGFDAAVERLCEVVVPAASGTCSMRYQMGEPIHRNVWASMFGCRALALTEPGSTLDWKHLV